MQHLTKEWSTSQSRQEDLEGLVKESPHIWEKKWLKPNAAQQYFYEEMLENLIYNKHSIDFIKTLGNKLTNTDL